jgi:phage-related protein
VTDAERQPLRGLEFVGSSRKDLGDFPDEVRVEVGYALYRAQLGERAPSVKTLSGFGGGGVVEIVENDDGDTYRCVYTVKLKSAVYVLHAFKKKSKRGSETPKHDIDLIRSRLREAEAEDQRTRT